MNDNTKFIVCALGIFFSYFYFGILQERITRGRYGDAVNEDGTHGEKFTFTLALVGIQCLWNWIFAKSNYRIVLGKIPDFLLYLNLVRSETMVYDEFFPQVF